MKRLILDKIPSGMQPIMGVAYDGVLDILIESEAPADALYVEEQDADGKTTVTKDVTQGKNLTPHTFAGWKVPAGGTKTVIEVLETIKK